MKTARPFVLINMAMSADGKIAPTHRRFVAFGSRRDHANLLSLRATADAVMCGARTVDSAAVTLDAGSAAALSAPLATPLVLGAQLAQVLLHPAWHAGAWGSSSELQRSGGTVDMPEEVHDLRKAIRDLRYAAEALAPASGVPLDDFIRTLKAWQDTLGAMHDAHVLASALGPWQGRLPRIEAGLSRRFEAHRGVWEAYRTQVLRGGGGWGLQLSEVALGHEGNGGGGVGSGQADSKVNEDL